MPMAFLLHFRLFILTARGDPVLAPQRQAA
jgi:hypothetical protein